MWPLVSLHHITLSAIADSSYFVSMCVARFVIAGKAAVMLSARGVLVVAKAVTLGAGTTADDESGNHAELDAPPEGTTCVSAYIASSAAR